MVGEVLIARDQSLAASIKEEDINNMQSDNHHETLSGMKMEYEAIPKFEEIRRNLVPLIKTDSWLKSTKDLLQKTTHSVFYKPLSNTSRIDFGFTVAILSGEDDYHYVLNSYLADWHISSATLVQIAQANLRKRLIQESNIWQTSQTGIRFLQGLGPLTAAVILLADVIEGLGIQSGDPVACVPVGDLCMIGESQKVTQLCVMGEIALRFPGNGNFLSTQPLRLLNKEWKIYEANKANDEHPLPRSGDEVKMLKRALKMQGKI